MMMAKKVEIWKLLKDDASTNYAITATDLDGVNKTILTSEGARKKMMFRYGTRIFYDPIDDDIDLAWSWSYRDWITNHQRGIDKMYQALFDYEYSPIENTDRYEEETTEGSGTTTHGHKITDGGSESLTHGHVVTDGGSESLTHGEQLKKTGTETRADTTTITDGGTTRTVTANTGTDTTSTGRSGMNSFNTYTKDTVEEQEHGHTVTDTVTHGKTETHGGSEQMTYNTTDAHSGSDQTTFGKTETHSGSDQTTFGKTETHSGSDAEETETSRTLHTHGNIGVTTNVELIEAELNLRLESLADMLINNLINDLTFYS